MSIQRRLWMTYLRLEKGMSQMDLAEKCGVSNRTISNIELGFRNPSGIVAKKIADTLDCDMKQFFETEKTA